VPPANDNIANATAITGASGSTTGDNTGATLETGEAECLLYTTANRFYRNFSPYTGPVFGYGGGRSVWYAWTCPADGWYFFQTDDDGGPSPIGDSILAVITGNDFTTARIAIPDDDSGPLSYSKVTFYAISGAIYYVAVDGSNGTPTDDPSYLITDTPEGSFQLSWGAGVSTDAKPYLVRAADDYNSGSATVSLVTNTRQEVRDTQTFTSISGKQCGTLEDATDTLYVRGIRLPLPGYYKMEIVHSESVGSGSSNKFLGMVLDGLAIQPAKEKLYTVGLNDASVELTNATNAVPTQRAWVLPIDIDSELTVRMIDQFAGATRHLDLYGLLFTPVDKIAPATDPAILFQIPDLMIGATSTPIDLDNDGDCTYHDLCVTDNGDIYVLMEQDTTSEKVRLRKWNGSSWSTISDDVATDAGVTGHATAPDTLTAVAIETDGTNVYCIFGWPDGTTSAGSDGTGAGTHQNWKWHCVKWNGSAFSELGSGQRHYPVHSGAAASAGRFYQGLEIKIGPDGKLWVAWSEWDPSGLHAFIVPTDSRAFLSYWDGAAWNEIACPDPPNMHGGAHYIVDLIRVDDQKQVDLTFCHSDGPNNWPSMAYNASIKDSGGVTIDNYFVYSEYNGSVWGNTIEWRAQDLWTSLAGGAGWQQGISLIDNGTVPYLVAAVAGVRDFVVAGRVNGSSIEVYTDHGYPSSVTDGWSDPTGAIADFANGKLIVITRSAQLGDLFVLVDEDIGTGQGYHVAAKANGSIVPTENSVGYARMYVKGSNVYLVDVSRAFTADPAASEYLGVWKIGPATPIVSFSAVRIPAGPHVTVR
jgi:hypothetical protein